MLSSTVTMTRRRWDLRYRIDHGGDGTDTERAKLRALVEACPVSAARSDARAVRRVSPSVREVGRDRGAFQFLQRDRPVDLPDGEPRAEAPTASRGQERYQPGPAEYHPWYREFRTGDRRSGRLGAGAAAALEVPMRYFILAIFLGGCLELGDSDAPIKGQGDGEEEEQGGGDGDDCKIEGEQIGQEGVVIYLGTKTVTFGNWVGKSGENGEYVGFSLTLSGGSSVSYVVKAGGERHPSTAMSWVHPAGPDGGSNAPGISNVDMCDDPGDDGDGDGDGDGCDVDCPIP